MEALVAGLESDQAVAREAAIARLTLLGPRAVARVTAFLESNPAPAACRAALRALEAIADAHALDAILKATQATDASVALAAVSAAGAFMTGPRGTAVIDRLTAAALDLDRPDTVRVAALGALRGLKRSTIAPLLEALATDPSPAIRALASGSPPREPGGAPAFAVEGDLPDEPDEVQRALPDALDRAPLPAVLDLIERIRDREASVPATRRPDWTRARGRAHLALAERDSRLALYDLRESLETASTPLPVEFLAALLKVGDASCLEAIAAAYARTAASRQGDGWWSAHLAEAFRTIVERERLTRRHAVVRKIERKWKGVFSTLWQTRQRPAPDGRSERSGRPAPSRS